MAQATEYEFCGHMSEDDRVIGLCMAIHDAGLRSSVADQKACDALVDVETPALEMELLDTICDG
jgi:hypothetical protein